MIKAIKKTGKFRGKSNRLGYGGRSAQSKARGVPGGVIGMLARRAHAAPGHMPLPGRRIITGNERRGDHI